MPLKNRVEAVQVRAFPQMEEETEFGIRVLEDGLRDYSQFWEEISRGEAQELMEERYMVASAFTHWEGVYGDGKREGRYL